ncbi:MAG TPA: quinolinate synthase, partial [Actinobacteria bacterium]|nr:quinolinate synthase [Actinomycetes bacterium]HEX21397.1 quinolinate synthase [Actinomycetota bacterium]
RAGCPLADTIDVEGLKGLKSAHPGTPVVCYVNSSAEIKAASDICCTSSNAVAVVESLNEPEVIFIPDKNLGKYVAAQTNKKIILWPGACPTHQRITREQVLKLKEEYPQAIFVAHPECEPPVLDLADKIGSTSAIYAFAKNAVARTIIIGSEMGMGYRLQKESPDKQFIFPSKYTVCPNMKLTTLKKVYRSLVDLKTKITVAEDIRVRAERAVRRMVEIG